MINHLFKPNQDPRAFILGKKRKGITFCGKEVQYIDMKRKEEGNILHGNSIPVNINCKKCLNSDLLVLLKLKEL